MFIPTAFSHIVKYIWTIPLSNMFKHFHALSNIFEEQQGICTRWGSIKSKSCLFQSAIPSHSCLSICPPRWGRSWWCERRANFAPARPPLLLPPLKHTFSADMTRMISYLSWKVRWMLIIWEAIWGRSWWFASVTLPLTWSTAVLRIVWQRTFKAGFW